MIIDANPTDDIGIPTEAYYSVENLSEAKSEDRRTFRHIPSSIGAQEAEEIGVEHLLRDIRVYFFVRIIIIFRILVQIL